MTLTKSIPARKYMMIVGLYAKGLGLPFLTWKQQRISIEKYEIDASKEN